MIEYRINFNISKLRKHDKYYTFKFGGFASNEKIRELYNVYGATKHYIYLSSLNI